MRARWNSRPRGPGERALAARGSPTPPHKGELTPCPIQPFYGRLWCLYNNNNTAESHFAHDSQGCWTSSPPPFAMSRRSAKMPMSPKEDGEWGETTADILARQAYLSPGTGKIVQSLDRHEKEITPLLAGGIHRLMSAKLSPMPGKVSPGGATEALDAIANVVLPRRRSERLELEEKKRQAAAESKAAATRIKVKEQERLKREVGEKRKAFRDSFAHGLEPAPPKKRTVDTRGHVSYSS